MIVQNMCNKISFSTLLTLEVSRLGAVLSKIIQATDIISSRTSDTCYVVIILICLFPFLFFAHSDLLTKYKNLPLFADAITKEMA